MLRDVNDARGMGFKNLAELYAYQTKQFGDLMNAGLAGTAVDMDKMLKGVNDPNVRDAMIRSYEAMRGLDDLAHGQPGSIEQLGALKDMLAESAALLPKGHPLGALALDAQKRITTAEQQLLSGTNGPYSRESMAALNNMANMTLGKLPDEAMMGGVAENLAEQAKSQGATDTQASALRDAIDIAYTIRSGNVTSTEGLSRANANLQTALDAAGKFAPNQLRALLNQAATQGTVGKTMSQAEQMNDSCAAISVAAAVRRAVAARTDRAHRTDRADTAGRVRRASDSACTSQRRSPRRTADASRYVGRRRHNVHCRRAALVA